MSVLCSELVLVSCDVVLVVCLCCVVSWSWWVAHSMSVNLTSTELNSSEVYF